MPNRMLVHGHDLDRARQFPRTDYDRHPAIDGSFRWAKLPAALHSSSSASNDATHPTRPVSSDSVLEAVLIENPSSRIAVAPLAVQPSAEGVAARAHAVQAHAVQDDDDVDERALMSRFAYDR